MENRKYSLGHLSYSQNDMYLIFPISPLNIKSYEI